MGKREPVDETKVIHSRGVKKARTTKIARQSEDDPAGKSELSSTVVISFGTNCDRVQEEPEREDFEGATGTPGRTTRFGAIPRGRARHCGLQEGPTVA